MTQSRGLRVTNAVEKRRPLRSIKNMVKRGVESVRETIRRPQRVRKQESVVGLDRYWSALDFHDDMLAYMLEKEQKQHLKEDFLRDTLVSRENRSRLVDWMMAVKEQLHLEQETLQLAVAILDRCLVLVKSVRGELQLLGLTTLFVARKFEEIAFVPEDMFDLNDHFSCQMILDMENHLLRHVRFQMDFVLPIHFLRHLYSKLPEDLFDLAVFFCDSAILRGLFLLPSQLTKAAVFLSSIVLNYQLESDVPAEIILSLAQVALEVCNKETTAVKEQYEKKWGPVTEDMIQRLENFVCE